MVIGGFWWSARGSFLANDLAGRLVGVFIGFSFFLSFFLSSPFDLMVNGLARSGHVLKLVCVAGV